MLFFRVLATMALVGCGGLVTTPGSDGGASDAPAVDASTLGACAHACVVATGGDCPTLLLYDCLQAACGSNASTEICEEGNGMPASLATIQCARTTFPACPANACQGSTTCKSFVACIEGCH